MKGNELVGKPRFLIVLGTRPEAIKLAPLILELRRRDASAVYVYATGQHDKMGDHALRFFKSRPDVNLGLLRQGQTLATVSAAIGVAIAMYGIRRP